MVTFLLQALICHFKGFFSTNIHKIGLPSNCQIVTCLCYGSFFDYICVTKEKTIII